MIQLGGTYVHGDLRFDSAHFVFVVVEDTPYVPPYGSAESPGFRCLVVCGEFVSGAGLKDQTVTPAGSHFVCAASSAIACDSVRFPAEE